MEKNEFAVGYLRVVLVALVLVLPFASMASVYADDREREAWKHWEEQEREARKHAEEQEREWRKHRAEQKREARKHRQEMAREGYGGPPDWAPAHGYRHKKGAPRRVHYEDPDREYEYEPEVTYPDLPAPITVTCNRDIVGGIIGGIIGGVLGSKIGDGKKVATAAGAAAGVLVGSAVGRQMDAADRRCTGQVLENAPDSQPVAWKDSEENATYTVTPLKTYQNDTGTYCREFRTEIIVDGQTEDNYGKACRANDGTWEIVS